MNPVNPYPISHQLRALQRTMAQAGWEITSLELDLTGVQHEVTIRCDRDDGRWIWARVDRIGRCVLESFQRTRTLGRPSYATGKWPLSPQVEDEFLSRQQAANGRELVRLVTEYLTDNATETISLGEVRRAWDAITDTRTRFRV
ncbi:hypothetical protein [Aeromonas sp. ARM81]|jgi:hypothetical protein|uniref:hypothetical protein n=1 Tax=Aeromonas sp. ARM81 TaxID=1747384 RepID=UPI000DF7759F|nr:hypothetical protein [Aeromonas sp. ARM81]RDD50693.1 hypothetical protein ASJ36_07725 [Aeromonas sp. ARM81]